MMKLNIVFGGDGEEGVQKQGKRTEELVQTLLKISSKEEMEEFLKGILTPKELLEIPNRLKIVKMLKKGIAQQEIAQELKVGVATVTRGSMELKKGRFISV